VTIIVNHGLPPAGSGGEGISAHVTLGISSRGPVVVREIVVATPKDQSHSTIGPGADEVLPSNVQLSVLPPFAIVHVSDSVGPVTPNPAVATIGGVTESVTDAEAPP
jgi:hypothetical protein